MIVLKERTFFSPKCSKGNKKKGHQSHYISTKKKKKKRTLTNKSIIIIIIIQIEKKKIEMYELSETQKKKKSIIHTQLIH